VIAGATQHPDSAHDAHDAHDAHEPHGGDHVSVELIDGQSLHGAVHSWTELPAATVLELSIDGSHFDVPLAAVRMVQRMDGDNAAERAGAHPAQRGPLLQGAVPRAFQIVFADTRVLQGICDGYENKKAGGLYLVVRQTDCDWRQTWIPRVALASARVGAPVSAPGSLAADMPDLFVRLEESRRQPVITLIQALFELRTIDEATLHQWRAMDGSGLRAQIDERLSTGQLTRAQFERARARVAGTPEIDAAAFKIESRAMAKIPLHVALDCRVLPLGQISKTLYVASATPMDHELKSRLSLIADASVSLVWADQAQIDARLAVESKGQPQPQSLAAAAGASAAATPKDHAPKATARMPARQGLNLEAIDLIAQAQHEVAREGEDAPPEAIDEHSAVVLLVKRIILDAYEQKASDVHIETNGRDEVSRVRFRKDGDLEEYLQVPPELRAALVSRIKVMSKLDISERRRPQDGKINFAEFSDTKLEMRVAILPTHDGLEDVVMRLLAASKALPLSKLGFSSRDQELIDRMAQHPYGLILACGPTGSGKTTSLHSLLSEINTEDRKIWTAEDPIEITQRGLRQLQVNSKIGVTFASAMRAFLRADPDVIMIGEIRDQETAHIAIEASLTGHLVLSTLHTNSAAESIVRLLDLGMDPMNFADSLVGIIAQRLVRALCPECKAAHLLTQVEFEKLAASYIEGTQLTADIGRQRLLQAAGSAATDSVQVYESQGCERCSGKGYKGRMGIYEVLENGPELKHLIERRAHTNEIFDQAVAVGMRSLKQDALEKVMRGSIDHDQARVVFTQPV
jgi:type II secretory ATPase GspE/PulE/Tfp pilus assembly ATPase PilB-like protein